MDLEKFKEEKSKLSTALEKHGRAMLVNEFQAFFKASPEIKAIRWTQYTPYFNDGDVCEFSRHDFEFAGEIKDDLKENAASYDSRDSDLQFFSIWDLKDNSRLKRAMLQLSKTFNNTEDVFEAAFGDGVKVVCSPNGFDVEEVDHD